LAAMDAVLRAHESGHLERIPLYAMLEVPLDNLKRRAARVGRRLRAAGVPARGRPTRATLGGGTTPEETMPSYGLVVPGGQQLTALLREADPPVISRIEDDHVVLDLRTVPASMDRHLEQALVAAYQGLKASQDAGA